MSTSLYQSQAMRVSRAEAAQNRERILDVAAQCFREHGFDGIGVADMMKAAGLTHGGFYGHFASKEDLMAQASARALAANAAPQKAAPGRTPRAAQTLAGVAGAYLSKSHRDRPSAGCTLAALGADAARQGQPVRDAFSAGVEAAVARLMPLFHEAPEPAQRAQALALCAQMLGALTLARAVGDRTLSDEILQTSLAAILSGPAQASQHP